jgi:hypothetical protein
MADRKTDDELALSWADHIKGKDRFEAAELADFLITEEGTTARIMDVYRAGGWFRVAEGDGGRIVVTATPEPPLILALRHLAEELEKDWKHGEA